MDIHGSVTRSRARSVVKDVPNIIEESWHKFIEGYAWIIVLSESFAVGPYLSFLARSLHSANAWVAMVVEGRGPAAILDHVSLLLGAIWSLLAIARCVVQLSRVVLVALLEWLRVPSFQPFALGV